MAIITKAIRLETTKQNLIQAVIAKQNDCNSRFLKVTFLDEGAVIPLDSSSEVTINAERKDGESKSFVGVVNGDNTATVPLHSWILELDGEANCDVSIIDIEGRKLTTTTFVVKVEKAACGSDSVSNDPQYDVLANLIEEVNATKENVANAIKDRAFGEVVSIEDVSPFEHEMTVKVANKNLFNPQYLKNKATVHGITYEYLPEEDCYLINGTHNTASSANSMYSSQYFEIPLEVGESYTASVTYISGTISGDNGQVSFGHSDAAGTHSSWFSVNLLEKNTSAKMVATKKYLVRFWLYASGGVTFENYKFRVQFEKGDAATEYGPYLADPSTVTLTRYGADETDRLLDYSPNADGTVEGVTSLYPTTTLITDTKGALIEVEYNADAKKYIDKKFAEIAAMIVSL